MKRIAILLYVFASVVALITVNPLYANDDPLTRMFEWFNESMPIPGAFTEAAFRKYFTEDTVLIVNGKKSAQGIPELTRHFQDIQARPGTVRIILPFVESFAQGDKIFTYHFVYRLVDGKEQCLRTMGYGVIKNEKIALIDFVRIPYEPGVSFDSGCQEK